MSLLGLFAPEGIIADLKASRRLRALFEPVDVAPLVWARIAFGTTMFIEVVRFFGHGWIARYFIEPQFFFAYPGFAWVRPLPGQGMYVLFAVMGAAAAGVAFGVFHRFSALTLAVLFTWTFLLDQTNYLNHGYLLCLLSWLFFVAPAASAGSVDARGRAVAHVPRWALLLIAGQLALVYLFGAVAKLDADWLSGDVAAFFLDHSALTAPVGESRAGRVTFAVSGLLFDLLVVPGLLWRRTRLLATAAAAMFHVSNALLFQIGVFPWLLLAMTPLFYPPAFTRRVLEWFGILRPQTDTPPPVQFNRAVAVAFIAWFTMQAALPLRHWLWRGQVNWTEEGHNFSWHMKLRVKRGKARFVVLSGDQIIEVEPRELLTRRQARKMATRPEMLRQFANELRRRYGADVEVHADATASLNGRPWQRFIDPTVDLGRQEHTLGAAKWIVSLQGQGSVGGQDEEDESE